jgi:hypothetical protein
MLAKACPAAIAIRNAANRTPIDVIASTAVERDGRFHLSPAYTDMSETVLAMLLRVAADNDIDIVDPLYLNPIMLALHTTNPSKRVISALLGPWGDSDKLKHFVNSTSELPGRKGWTALHSAVRISHP